MTPTLAQRLAMRELPALPFVMHQCWEQLLFLHWSFDPTLIQASMPPGLTVDVFDGKAWVAIVPFLMRKIRPRFSPAVPGVSNFLETNLRTYVYDEQGRPGVWFYSLECNQPLAVWVARTGFYLPYQHASMTAVQGPDQRMIYTSQRRGDAQVSRFEYQLRSRVGEAEPGSLEFFLAERYALFSKTPRGLRLGRVHHRPYPVAQAEVSSWDTRLFTLNGLPEPGRPPDHIMGSEGVQVRVFPLQTTDLP